MYTLCGNSTPWRAVTAVGHLEAEHGEPNAYVAYFTDSTSEQDVVDVSELVPLGVDLPSPLMTVVPIVSRLFSALEHGGVDVGWSGYVVGSGVASRVLHALAPFVGARRLVDFDITAPPEEPPDRAGSDLFLVTDPEESRLTSWLSSIPDGSLVALVVPPAGSSPRALNFYDTIHKKSLTLLGHSGAQIPAQQRAVRLGEMRLDGLASDIPVYDAPGDDGFEPGDHPALILQWS